MYLQQGSPNPFCLLWVTYWSVYLVDEHKPSNYIFISHWIVVPALSHFKLLVIVTHIEMWSKKCYLWFSVPYLQEVWGPQTIWHFWPTDIHIFQSFMLLRGICQYLIHAQIYWCLTPKILHFFPLITSLFNHWIRYPNSPWCKLLWLLYEQNKIKNVMLAQFIIKMWLLKI